MMTTEHCCAWNPRRNTSHETTAFEITGCRAPRLRHRRHCFVNAADRAGCSSAALVQGGLAATHARGPASDENMRFTPEAVTNERLEVKLYGAGSAPVRAAEHEGRIDLWTGLATSPVALTLRDKRNYLDLTGLARLRWIVRTNAIHTLYPVVKR